MATPPAVPRDLSRPLPPELRRERGFSLLEALVSLLILEMALLMGLALVLEQPRIVRRLDRQREVLRALESTLELIRAGVVPLQSGTVEPWLLLSGVPLPPGTSIQMEVEPVAPPGPAGLFHVKVLARWLAAGILRTREVETFVWSPGGSP